MNSYGITSRADINDAIELHAESIRLKGFSVEKELFSPAECEAYCRLVDEVYARQEQEFSRSELELIHEEDLARMPFMYRPEFASLFMHPLVLNVAEKVLGRHFQLHLQNAIINKPARTHHQTSWHRDLPYQDWVISKPLGVNAFICLTDFTETNGATEFLPFSHKIDHFPSQTYVDANKVKLTAPAGSVVFFDSMLYHRASQNKADMVRYGLNNMFVVPILKQQLDLAAAGPSITDNPEIRRILGCDFVLDRSVHDYRKRKLEKAKRK